MSNENTNNETSALNFIFGRIDKATQVELNLNTNNETTNYDKNVEESNIRFVNIPVSRFFYFYLLFFQLKMNKLSFVLQIGNNKISDDERSVENNTNNESTNIPTVEVESGTTNDRPSAENKKKKKVKFTKVNQVKNNIRFIIKYIKSRNNNLFD